MANTPEHPGSPDDLKSQGVELEINMEELPQSECWAVLRTSAVGRLAVCAGGDRCDVDIFPVNYVVDHGSIVFRTAAGTKLDRLTAEHRTTFEADDSDFSDGIAWSVIAKGPCDAIKAHADLISAFDLDVQPWHAGSKPTFVRLVPEIITGRRFTIDPDVLASDPQVKTANTPTTKETSQHG